VKGNRRIALMSLKTPSTVTPTNRNGKAINQISGNKTITSRAIGHETTNNRHHKITAIKNLIRYVLYRTLFKNVPTK
jgi:hypothetical protein